MSLLINWGNHYDVWTETGHAAERKRLYAKDLCTGAERNRAVYSAYENEMRHPDYFGLIALADYFNVSLDYLVGRSDRRERNP